MIAITASTGTLGQTIIEELRTNGLAHQVRLTARDPEKLHAAVADGFQVAKADYADVSTLETAFQRVRVLVLISGNAPAEIRTRQHFSVIDAAKRVGVKHVVYTSLINPSTRSKFFWAVSNKETESYLRKSGLAYTIVRNNQYASNLRWLLIAAQESGVFAIPGAKGGGGICHSP